MGRRWNRFWSRKVAASAYGAFVLAFATLAVPPAYLADGWLRVVFGVLALGCMVGFIYEWWFRKRPRPAAPCVRLEIRRDCHVPEHTYVVAMNDEDLAA